MWRGGVETENELKFFTFNCTQPGHIGAASPLPLGRSRSLARRAASGAGVRRTVRARAASHASRARGTVRVRRRRAARPRARARSVASRSVLQVAAFRLRIVNRIADTDREPYARTHILEATCRRYLAGC